MHRESSIPTIPYMKLRNKILAGVLFLGFLALTSFYYNFWVTSRPFGVIILLADGLDNQLMAEARQLSDGSLRELSLDTMSAIALLSHKPKDSSIPDAAAYATSIATGSSGRINRLSLNQSGHPLKTLLDEAKNKKRVTGILTNAELSTPWVSAFYANHGDATRSQEILSQLVDLQRVDLAIGRGSLGFLPVSEGGFRDDGRNLFQELQENHYSLPKNIADLENSPFWRPPKLVAVFDNLQVTSKNEISDQKNIWLHDVLRHAIRLLQYNPRGYLLIVNVEPHAFPSPDNQQKPSKPGDSTLYLDRCIKVARKYAGDKTLIVALGKPDASLQEQKDTVIAATGPGSEKFHGVMTGTKVFSILKDEL